MQQVPKFVTERLRAGESRTNHPDPDLLTAFAEQSLPDRERAGVLAHLSRCTDCREIVALALPEIDAAQKTLQPSRESWLTWPALRWAFVAAGVLAIASFGIVRYRTNARAVSTAVSVSLKEQAVTKEAKNELPTPPAIQTPPAMKSDKAPASQRLRSAPDSEPMGFVAGNLTTDQQSALTVLPQRTEVAKDKTNAYHASTVNGTVGGPLAKTNQAFAYQQQGPTQAPVPSAPAQPQFGKQARTAAKIAPPPPATQTVEVSGASPIVQTEVQTEVAELKKENSGLQGAAADSSQYDAPVGRAKPADVAASQSAGAVPIAATVGANAVATPVSNLPVNGRDVTSLATLSPVNAPRWTINSKGILQRSFDQGKTWHDVTVIASAGSVSSSFAVREVAVEAATAKSQGANKKAGDQVQIFRALAVNGIEVWAGGANTILYHSIDAGNHWTRVLPTSSSAALTGDVLTVDFPDPQHGKITTSTSEVWSTVDAGQTWQKQ